MSISTKSPIKVARVSYGVGKKVLREYSHKKSPQKYTLAQLFSCLVLKVFFATDYRGVVELLEDFSDLRRVLDMQQVPHFTTLHKASSRILGHPRIDQLLATTVQLCKKNFKEEDLPRLIQQALKQGI